MPYTGSNNAGTFASETAARAHEALDTAVDKASPTVNRMVDKAHATIDRVAQTAVPAAEAVQSAVNRTTAATSRFADACADNVRAQPLASLAIAAAVGYIAGRVMR